MSAGGEPQEPGCYRQVHALSKGLLVLAELNRLGRAKPSEIARIDRTTVYRLLNTLAYEGMVVRTLPIRFIANSENRC